MNYGRYNFVVFYSIVLLNVFQFYFIFFTVYSMHFVLNIFFRKKITFGIGLTWSNFGRII